MSDHPQDRLLDALSENSLIKAVLIINHQGIIKGRRGNAKVIKTSAKERQTQPTHEVDDTTHRENIYMVEMIQDILVVIFDEGIDLERLRNTVDRLLRHTKLERLP